MLIGIEITAVLCITMTETGSGKTISIIVNHHRSEHDLIATIPIHIGHSIIVKALSVPRRTYTVAIPAPALAQLMGTGIHVECNHLVTGIDTTGKENARLAAIQIGCAEEMLRGAVSITITPGFFQVGLTAFQTL